jgi:hypothetical protein
LVVFVAAGWGVSTGAGLSGTDGLTDFLDMMHLEAFSLTLQRRGRALKTASRTADIFPEGILLVHTRPKAYRQNQGVKIAQTAGVRPLEGVFKHHAIRMP